MDNAVAPQPRDSRGGGHFSVPVRAPEIVAAEAGAANLQFIPLQGHFNRGQASTFALTLYHSLRCPTLRRRLAADRL
jgi:hypothetical protein